MYEFLARLFCRPKFLADMARVRLEPDDLLVLSVDEALSSENAAAIKENLRGIFGEGQRVLVLEGGVKLGVIQCPNIVSRVVA